MKETKEIKVRADIKTRFTSENNPRKGGRKKGSTASDWLRRLSRTNINFLNPMTGKKEIGEVNLVVALQLILKATKHGDLPSIREYFDRLDGKVVTTLEHSGKIDGIGTKIIIIRDNARTKDKT